MDKTELIMLGTGNAMATACYNTCFALRRAEGVCMVDAGGGNGIFRQMDRADIACEEVHHLFMTHAHTDHLLGMVWMVRNVAMRMNKGSYIGDCYIYGHDEVCRALQTICNLTLSGKLLSPLGKRIHIVEVKDGEKREVLGMECTFFDIGSTKMKQFGFQALLEDGQRVVCLGDEPYNERNRRYVAGCDWLLCEAFCLYEDRDRFKPYEKHHSTALDAGKLAEELGVKNLLLYHTEDKTLSRRKQTYMEEAQKFFSGYVVVPDDLDRIAL